MELQLFLELPLEKSNKLDLKKKTNGKQKSQLTRYITPFVSYLFPYYTVSLNHALCEWIMTCFILF